MNEKNRIGGEAMPRKVWLLVAGMIINVTGASFLRHEVKRIINELLSVGGDS